MTRVQRRALAVLAKTEVRAEAKPAGLPIVVGCPEVGSPETEPSRTHEPLHAAESLVSEKEASTAVTGARTAVLLLVPNTIPRRCYGGLSFPFRTAF
jgi:hypothetical protein